MNLNSVRFSGIEKPTTELNQLSPEKPDFKVGDTIIMEEIFLTPAREEKDVTRTPVTLLAHEGHRLRERNGVSVRDSKPEEDWVDFFRIKNLVNGTEHEFLAGQYQSTDGNAYAIGKQTLPDGRTKVTFEESKKAVKIVRFYSLNDAILGMDTERRILDGKLKGAQTRVDQLEDLLKQKTLKNKLERLAQGIKGLIGKKN